MIILNYFIAVRFNNIVVSCLRMAVAPKHIYIKFCICWCCCFWRDSPPWARASSFTRFLDHRQRCTTVNRTLLDESSPLPENIQCSQQTDIHAPGGIRTHNLSRRAAADLRLRPHGQWLLVLLVCKSSTLVFVLYGCTCWKCD